MKAAAAVLVGGLAVALVPRAHAEPALLPKRAVLRLAQPFAARLEGGEFSSGSSSGGVLVARLTGALENLDLTAGAERLAELAGVPINVPPPPKEIPDVTPDPTEPRLDYARRASLAWKETPVAEAFRQFCRAYGCLLQRDFRGNLTLAPGKLPSGPELHQEGYTLSLNRLAFSDYRSTGDAPEDLTVRRILSLLVSVRADSGETAAISAIENLRAVDQAGRDVLDQTADNGFPSPGARTLPTAFPDERVQSITFEWPYPRPYRLKLIEGDLVLYRSVRRTAVEVAVPRDDDGQTVARLGEGQILFSQVHNLPNSFSASMRVAQPTNVDFASPGAPTPLVLVLEDGSKVPVAATLNSWGYNDGDLTGYVSLSAGNLKSRAVRLIWSLATRSDTTRRVHFRFDNYPAILGPPPAAEPTPHPPAPSKAVPPKPAMRKPK